MAVQNQIWFAEGCDGDVALFEEMLECLRTLVFELGHIMDGLGAKARAGQGQMVSSANPQQRTQNTLLHGPHSCPVDLPLFHVGRGEPNSNLHNPLFARNI